MSSNWREQYFAALGARDAVEKANENVYDSYTRLADRLASFSNQGSDGAALQTKQLHGKEKVGQNTLQKDAQRQTGGGATEDVVVALRADLAQAQRSRADLQRRLAKVNEELELSRESARKGSKKVELLTGERNTLSRRLKDRDEELKGKAKLLDVRISLLLSL
ncbi:hypothetical protein KEM55_003148 [Ascosphaera atra]|nr:hypothetical protein KEM55_003148 [Ascosphaera atra]